MNVIQWFVELGHNRATRNAAEAIDTRCQTEQAIDLQLSRLAYRSALTNRLLAQPSKLHLT